MTELTHQIVKALLILFALTPSGCRWRCCRWSKWSRSQQSQHVFATVQRLPRLFHGPFNKWEMSFSLFVRKRWQMVSPCEPINVETMYVRSGSIVCVCVFRRLRTLQTFLAGYLAIQASTSLPFTSPTPRFPV